MATLMLLPRVIKWYSEPFHIFCKILFKRGKGEQFQLFVICRDSTGTAKTHFPVRGTDSFRPPIGPSSWGTWEHFTEQWQPGPQSGIASAIHHRPRRGSTFWDSAPWPELPWSSE